MFPFESLVEVPVSVDHVVMSPNYCMVYHLVNRFFIKLHENRSKFRLVSWSASDSPIWVRKTSASPKYFSGLPDLAIPFLAPCF